MVNQLIDLGELTPAEAATFNRRNVITRAMQPALEVRFKPEIHHTIDIHPGDLFFLCSDGMLEHMDEQNLRYIFSLEGGDLRAKHDTLLRATAENTDNHSAFIILIEEVTGHAVAQADEEETLPPFGKAKQNAPAVMPPSEKEKSDESTAVKTAVPDGSYETAAPIVSETKEEANKKTAPPRHLAFSTILLGATIVIFLLAALLFFLF